MLSKVFCYLKACADVKFLKSACILIENLFVIFKISMFNLNFKPGDTNLM